MFKSRYELIFTGGILVVILIFIVRNTITSAEIDKNGVFVLGEITEVHRSKNGLLVKGWTSYKNEIYNISAKPGFTFNVYVGKRFFIKLRPDNPRDFDYVVDREVPFCIDSAKNMGVVWEKLPYCN
ncbi:hypothetical protein [Chitinophaga deserti]|uniref:hypothetical protein n=1 Tax=Chitinophaga deserti TaxID=2164099 RepID=UPI0013003F25|nr:hypothetical protein [Chitinophaga deserti]